MKIRNGFVSNSSSSSFIVAFKKTGKCPHCGGTPIDLVDVVVSMNDGDSRVRGTGASAVLSHFDEDFPEQDELFAQAKELEKKGFTIACFDISNNSDSLFSALVRGLSESVVLYHSE